MSKAHPIFERILDEFQAIPARVAAATTEHIESADCWCQPTLNYVDPDTGTQHWIHHESN
jgi:hypothetical protein